MRNVSLNNFLSAASLMPKNYEILALINAVKDYVKGRNSRDGNDSLTMRNLFFESIMRIYELEEEDFNITLCFNEKNVSVKEIIEFALSMAYYGYNLEKSTKKHAMTAELISGYIDNILVLSLKNKAKKQK